MSQQLPRWIVLIGVLLSGIHGVTDAEDHNWPQWRGPLGTGVAPNADPPIEWSETKNLRWKVPLSDQRAFKEVGESRSDARALLLLIQLVPIAFDTQEHTSRCRWSRNRDLDVGEVADRGGQSRTKVRDVELINEGRDGCDC